MHAKVGPIQHRSFEEVALRYVCNLKLIVACIGFIETTEEKNMLNGSGKVPVPKNVCLENVPFMCCTRATDICLHCIDACRVTAVGARVRTAVVRFERFDLFGLRISLPAGSHPAWRTPSGTLTKDTSQCGHPSAVHLQQSTGTPCSSCCCMGEVCTWMRNGAAASCPTQTSQR